MAGKTAAPLTADSPLTALSGISDTRAAAFAKLGILTLSDLCRHYPRAYELRGRTTTVSEAKNGETVSLLLTVGKSPSVATLRRGMVLLRFSAFDATGSCVITYFNQPYLKNTFAAGRTFRFYGRVERAGGRVQMSSPRCEELPAADPGDGSTLPSVYPLYRLSAGLTQKLMQSTVKKALAVVYPQDKTLPDPLPDEIRQKYSLCGRRFALENIHNPPNESAMDVARRRLIFEELVLFALGLRLRRAARMEKPTYPMDAPDMEPFFAAQPFALTNAQKRTVSELLRDMTAGGAPMNRLLSGDVGSGKTVCAAAALYIAVKNGYQAALMAPTEILARQHFADLAPMFEKFGVKTALLVGSTKAKEKREIKTALEDGELPLVIGTHALLEDNVVFENCGLVVTDEQHRFGVGQRAALAKKGAYAHTLIMSATPIPRTLALMLYGDLDLSVLDEMPPGRQKVSTFAVDESYRDRLNGFIRRQVEEGHQVYIVCPAVDENEDDDFTLFGEEDEPERKKPDMKAAVAFAKQLSEEVFPDLPVGFLHGKMKGAEKDAVMARFVSREIMILVSTTVIEVGVNVPSATLMVVENADRFGLSQLHQLRGRVGRGRDKSWCILVSEAKSEEARERLDILCKTNSGYEVAKKDLEMRGPGDFFAGSDFGGGYADCRQSGGVRFAIASLCDDMEILEEAFSAAEMLASDDPRLAAHPALREAVSLAFGNIVF